MTGRITPDGLMRRRARLSERDEALLRTLQAHRFMTTNQLAQLFFARTDRGAVATRACVRVLGRLRELDLIERLERQVGGHHAGSAAYVWRVSTTGQRLLLLGTEQRYQRTLHLPSLEHLAHVLAITEVRVLFEELARKQHFELLDVELEPTCWRPYVGPEGAPRTLKPDLAVVTASGDFEEHYFIEVDRGRAGLAVLLRKCAEYTVYARSGREQAARGVFPYVLWLVPTSARARRLHAAVAESRDVDASLLRIATPEGLPTLLTASSPAQAATTDDTAGLTRLLAGGAHARF